MQFFYVFIVGFGAFFGGIFRYLINLACTKYLSINFPLHTFIINIIGSFFIGFFVNFLKNIFVYNTSLYCFLITGILGGFTTFSSFSLEFFMMLEKKYYLLAFIYLFGSIFLSFIGVIIGLKLGKYIQL